ncbi:MAG: Gfo/Idh/MocA family oxidoreductase [Actinobacteria bacterium]|jgi:predicted dehydrogenase|nr:Gfo/Idh/MocA family oxidoreductase [Actinomycetota bacterium]
MRIAFLGTGLIAWAHSLVLKAMADNKVIDVSIVTCFDPDKSRSKQFSAVHGCIAADSPQKALDGADAVWICTSTAQHRQLVKLAADAGVAIFLEKPLGRSLFEAREIEKTVNETGILAQVGLVLRRAPIFVKCKSILDSESFGQLMAISFRDDQFFPVTGHYASTWRGDVTQAGGGTIIEHSIHDLDILNFCTESVGGISKVSATTSNFAGYEGIEDAAVVNLTFNSGAAASLVSVWHQIISRPSTRRVEVICEKGIIWFETDFIGSLHVLTDDGHEVYDLNPPKWVTDLPLPANELGLSIRMYAEADRAFIDSVSNGNQPSPSISSGVASHQLVEAVYSSAKLGGVPVDPWTL